MTTGMQPLFCQEVDLNYLCQKSPLYSRCSGNSLIKQSQTQAIVVPQVIKVKLNKVSNVTEWVRIERTGNQLKVLQLLTL